MRVAKGCHDGRCDGAAGAAGAAVVPCRPSCPCPCLCPSWERRPACLAVHTSVGTPQLWGGPRRAVEATARLHAAKAALRCAWARPELSEYPEKHMGSGPQAGQMACSPRAGVLSTRCSRLSGAMASAASVGESGSCLPSSSNRCSANGIPAAQRARARVGTRFGYCHTGGMGAPSRASICDLTAATGTSALRTATNWTRQHPRVRGNSRCWWLQRIREAGMGAATVSFRPGERAACEAHPARSMSIVRPDSVQTESLIAETASPPAGPGGLRERSPGHNDRSYR